MSGTLAIAVMGGAHDNFHTGLMHDISARASVPDIYGLSPHVMVLGFLGIGAYMLINRYVNKNKE
jgi:hypothetical protein